MSKHSFTYNINQRKYSLKFIIYIFILFDILLSYYMPFPLLYIIIGWEVSVILGLLIGMRGQARYRELVYDLIAIRKDPRYNNKEELRGFKLARHIDHACIEYDLWYNENEERKFKLKRKDKKKTKKFGGKINMKEKTIIEILRAVAGIWLWLGFGLGDILIFLDIRLFWVVAILGCYWVADLFFWLIMENEFGIFKEDVEVIEIPIAPG